MRTRIASYYSPPSMCFRDHAELRAPRSQRCYTFLAELLLYPKHIDLNWLFGSNV